MVVDENVVSAEVKETRKRKRKSIADDTSNKKSNKSGLTGKRKSGEVAGKRKSGEVAGKRKSGELSVQQKSSEWTCSSCEFTNFALKSNCNQCNEARPTKHVEADAAKWCCKCGVLNKSRVTKCTKCAADRSTSIVEHRVGMSHMSYEVTEEDIRKFFSPLELESVELIRHNKARRNVGKANAVFKSHNDALKAMDKNKTDVGGWEVNLYLNSTDSSTETEIRDKMFSWNNSIKSQLKLSENTATCTQLTTALLPKYIHITGATLTEEEFQQKLEERLSKHSKFTYKDGTVSM